MAADQDLRNPCVGWFRTMADGPEVRIEWQVAGGTVHSALFSDLATRNDHDSLRLEFGWMMSTFWSMEGERMLLVIPGPNEAMRESNFYFREARRWSAWAVAEAPVRPTQSAKKVAKPPV
jgi:hypothetical protein